MNWLELEKALAKYLQMFFKQIQCETCRSKACNIYTQMYINCWECWCRENYELQDPLAGTNFLLCKSNADTWRDIGLDNCAMDYPNCPNQGCDPIDPDSFDVTCSYPPWGCSLWF